MSLNISNFDCNDIETVKPYAFSICRKYLDKTWSQAEINDFQIERLV